MQPLRRHAKVAFIIAGVSLAVILFWGLVIPLYFLIVLPIKEAWQFIISYVKETGMAIAGTGITGAAPMIFSMLRETWENRNTQNNQPPPAAPVTPSP